MLIAFVGQKGGVGKSTLALNVAAELMSRGQRALIVDADPQGTALTWGDEAARASREAPTIVAMGSNMHRPGQLAQVAASYDMVAIDCPGRLGDVQRSALLAADVAVLPCGPSPADAWALAASLDVVESARALRADLGLPELKVCVAITRVQTSTAPARTARAREVLSGAGVPVLKSELGYRVAYQDALAAGQGVTAFAPSEAAAAEVRALVDELITFAKGDPHGKASTDVRAA